MVSVDFELNMNGKTIAETVGTTNEIRERIRQRIEAAMMISRTFDTMIDAAINGAETEKEAVSGALIMGIAFEECGRDEN